MENLSDKDKINKAVELFREFITSETSLPELYQELDKLMLEYATLLINEDSAGHAQRADKLYTIYALKRICHLDKPIITGKAA